jgi:hypothetical protein
MSSLRRSRTLLLAGLAGLALSSAQAASVKVSFVGADSYVDAGNSVADRKANLATLAAHLSGLGQRLLPADGVLEIEVLEVDLAGTLQPSRHGVELRVVRGKSDWPRMTLRYRLVEDGQVRRTGTERIADMTYTVSPNSHGASDPLHYEKRMLDDWFRTRFVDPAAVAR